MKSDSTLRVEKEKGRLKLILTNPPHNYLHQSLLQEMSSSLEQVRGEEHLKLIIFSSGVDNIFSKGFDFNELTPERVGGLVAAFGHLLSVLNNQEAITIVEVDGICQGGGMELAAYCDLIIASNRSHFSHPEVKYGVFPPVAAALYTHLMGRNRCIDMLVTGRELTAREANEIGLITRIWPDDQFSLAVEKYYASIESNSAVSLHLTKKAIEKSLYERVDTAISTTDNIYLNELLPTHDAQEGISAKLEMRKPQWKDR